MDKSQTSGPDVELLGDEVGVTGAEDIEPAAFQTALGHQFRRRLNIGQFMVQNFLHFVLQMIKVSACCFHCHFLRYLICSSNRVACLINSSPWPLARMAAIAS